MVRRARVGVAIVAGRFAAVGLISLACSAAPQPVETADEALSVARAAWESLREKNPSHGNVSEEYISKFEPYSAIYRDGVWIVRGTIPPGYRGLVTETTVRSSDGSVSVTTTIAK